MPDDAAPPIMVRFFPGFDEHGDISVLVGTYEVVADSYYFRLLAPRSDRSDASLCGYLASVLDAWTTEVETLGLGEERYFAYDLSDQYSEWLEVRSVDELTLSICAVMTHDGGYRINPMEPARQLSGLQSCSPPTTVPKAALIAALRASAIALRSQCDRLNA